MYFYKLKIQPVEAAAKLPQPHLSTSFREVKTLLKQKQKSAWRLKNNGPVCVCTYSVTQTLKILLFMSSWQVQVSYKHGLRHDPHWSETHLIHVIHKGGLGLPSRWNKKKQPVIFVYPAWCQCWGTDLSLACGLDFLASICGMFLNTLFTVSSVFLLTPPPLSLVNGFSL